MTLPPIPPPPVRPVRRRRFPRRLALHLLLIAACLPALFPFFWLIGSSLQRRENVFAAPPRFLPHTETVLLHADHGDLPVHVLDRGDDTGAWRARIRSGEEEAPGLPTPPWAPAAVTNSVTLGRIGQLEQRVVPVEELPDGGLRARVPGRRRHVEVDAEQVEETTITRRFVRAFRFEVEVDADAGRVTAPSPPFAVAIDRVETGPGTTPVVAAAGTRFPVEIVDDHEGPGTAAAGIARVRVVPGPLSGDPDPASIVERTVSRVRLLTADGPVTCRWLRRPGNDGRGAVVIPDELDEIVLPAAAWRVLPTVEHRVEILGQPVRVRALAEDAGRWEVLDPVVAATDRFESSEVVDPQWVNYRNALEHEPFHLYLLNSLFITTCCVLGNVLSCGLVGYAFARIPFRGRGILFLLLLSTMMVPGQVTMIPTFALFTRLGWLDSYKPLILPAFLAQAAFFVFLYRQFFLSVPYELEEAARVDGAGPLTTFWHIMLPIAKPAAVTVAVFSFLGAWNDFLGPLLYIASDERQTLALGLQNFKSSFGYSDPHYLMAASLLMMLPTLVIFFSAQRAFMRGVVVSGVKG